MENSTLPLTVMASGQMDIHNYLYIMIITEMTLRSLGIRGTGYVHYLMAKCTINVMNKL